ncbi:hypothetical protein B0H13DRAFT_1875238 [Mycena leptocephala]|nr:hypothetical protein B0H13DRAFT_1875238 [Mycena leptocephala]
MLSTDATADCASGHGEGTGRTWLGEEPATANAAEDRNSRRIGERSPPHHVEKMDNLSQHMGCEERAGNSHGDDGVRGDDVRYWSVPTGLFMKCMLRPPDYPRIAEAYVGILCALHRYSQRHSEPEEKLPGNHAWDELLNIAPATNKERPKERDADRQKTIRKRCRAQNSRLFLAQLLRGQRTFQRRAGLIYQTSLSQAE